MVVENYRLEAVVVARLGLTDDQGEVEHICGTRSDKENYLKSVRSILYTYNEFCYLPWHFFGERTHNNDNKIVMLKAEIDSTSSIRNATEWAHPSFNLCWTNPRRPQHLPVGNLGM